ncbi:MAG: regulatory protein RecX [Thermobispora bispora]|nr:regulatory protein RecX [Thermobispora bispora]
MPGLDGADPAGPAHGPDDAADPGQAEPGVWQEEPGVDGHGRALTRGDRGRGAAAGRARRGSGRSGRPGRRWAAPGAEQAGPGGAGADTDPEAEAKAICLRLLARAPRTRAQLADALRRRGVPEETARAVLDRFAETGLIDDEAFADAWVSSRHLGRGLARRALAHELRHRGVAEETVRRAIDRLDPEREIATARELVARKLAATRGADPRVRARRAVGMLARKGYPAGLAFQLVREALEAEGIEADDLGPSGDP